jgi:hypothetical protein
MLDFSYKAVFLNQLARRMKWLLTLQATQRLNWKNH